MSVTMSDRLWIASATTAWLCPIKPALSFVAESTRLTISPIHPAKRTRETLDIVIESAMILNHNTRPILVTILIISSGFDNEMSHDLRLTSSGGGHLVTDPKDTHSLVHQVLSEEHLAGNAAITGEGAQRL